MLDCVALLALELLPSFEGVVASHALTAFHLGEARMQLMYLLCMLVQTGRTRAFALSRGAGARLSRALAGALVSA